MALHRTSDRWQLGLALAFITSCLWGILPLTLEIALEGAGPVTITWFRFLVAFIVLGLWLATRGQLPKRRLLTRPTLKQLAIATIFLGGNYLTFLLGIQYTTVGNAEIVIQLAPLLLALGGLVFFRERYSWVQWAGVAVLVAGVLGFMKDKVAIGDVEQSAYFLGSAIIVLAAGLWAVYALIQKQLLLTLSSPQILWSIYGGCLLLYTPLARPQILLHQTPLQWGALLACAANTLLAYGAFAESLNHWEASRISAIIALTPILTLVFVDGAAWGWPHLFEMEPLTRLGWGSAFVVVLGSWMVALGTRKGSPNRSHETRS